MQVSKQRPKAIAYIDGLNLYHSHLKRKPEYKWLDLLGLMDLHLPEYEIIKVHYFTAIVSSKISDPLASTRQKAYLRALETTGERLAIHHGRMRVEEITVKLKGPVSTVVKAHKATEKESDVGLASQMVHDAHTSEADYLILLSNDTDFAPALRIIALHTSKKIGVLCPNTKLAGDLAAANIHSVWTLDSTKLGLCQLPELVTDKFGDINRPESWT